MSESIIKKMKITAVISTLIIIVAILSSYLLRGYIVINDPENIVESAQAINLSSFNAASFNKGKPLFTLSGEYSITVKLKDGSHYIKHVSVPSFLKKVDITPNYKENQLSILSNSAFTEITAVDQSTLVNYEYNGNYKKINTLSNIDKKGFDENINNFYDSTPIADEFLGGLIKEEVADNIIIFTPAIYNIKTRKFIYYDALVSTNNSFAIRAYSDGFAVYDLYNKKIHTYSIKSKEAVILNIESTIKPAQFDEFGIFDINDNQIAILEGNNIKSGGDLDKNTSTSPNINSSRVQLVDRKNEHSRVEIKIPHKEKFESIKLSPNGSYVLLSRSSSLYVYSTKSSDLVFFINLRPEIIKWIDNDSFILSSTTQGIFKVNVGTKEAISIMPASILSVVSLGNILDDAMYFTAFTKNDSSATLPNVYKLQLSNESGDGNELIEKLPVYQSGYNIKAKNHETIIITIKPGFMNSSGDWVDEDKIKESAINYINNNLKNSNKYKFEFLYDLAPAF